jgi:hypothetical protein
MEDFYLSLRLSKIGRIARRSVVHAASKMGAWRSIMRVWCQQGAERALRGAVRNQAPSFDYPTPA